MPPKDRRVDSRVRKAIAGAETPKEKKRSSKVAGYKINTSKSVAFLYSKDKQAEKEIREMTPFTIDYF